MLRPSENDQHPEIGKNVQNQEKEEDAQGADHRQNLSDLVIEIVAEGDRDQEKGKDVQETDHARDGLDPQEDLDLGKDADHTKETPHQNQ